MCSSLISQQMNSRRVEVHNPWTARVNKEAVDGETRNASLVGGSGM